MAKFVDDSPLRKLYKHAVGLTRHQPEPVDIEGMSPAKAIMDHYSEDPELRFWKRDAIRWVVEQGYQPGSHSGPCTQLMRNGYIERCGSKSWPRRFVRPFGASQLQPTRYDAEGHEHEGQHRP